MVIWYSRKNERLRNWGNLRILHIEEYVKAVIIFASCAVVGVETVEVIGL